MSLRFVVFEDSVGHVYVNPSLVRWVADTGLGNTVIAFGPGDGPVDGDGAAGTLTVLHPVDSVVDRLQRGLEGLAP